MFLRNESKSAIPLILETDIGGDADDALALLVLLGYMTTGKVNIIGVMTNHIRSYEKAKIAKIILSETGFGSVPVYAGESFDNMSSNDFLKKYPGWNALFGYPQAAAGEKSWYENQGKAYREVFGKKFDDIHIEKKYAAQAIVDLSRQYSPQNKLTILAIGPLDNIKAALEIDPTLALRIKIHAMGGPDGYNWMISPQTTAFVLSRVKDVVCVTSHAIKEMGFYIKAEELDFIEKKATSKLGEAIIKDWRNWRKGYIGKNGDVTMCYDPGTVMTVINPDMIKSTNVQYLTFPCLDELGTLKPEYVGIKYSDEKIKGKMVTLNSHPLSSACKVTFITEINSPIINRSKMIDAIMARLMAKPLDQKENLTRLNISQVGIFSKKTDHAKHLCSILREAKKCFIESKQSELSFHSGLVKIYKKSIQGKTFKIFGVKKEDQSKLDFNKLRDELSQELEFKKMKSFLQVVGDSKSFNQAGSQRCREYLSDQLENTTDSIILYGLTGNTSKEGCVDSNQAVNEWIDEKPETRSNRVIANAVDMHTITAIEERGCTISNNVTNILLVYTDSLLPTVKFGDDNELADGLTNEKTICFEGGVQSLEQIIKLIIKKVPIDGVSGLRESALDNRISAIDYLDYIKQKISVKNIHFESDIKQYHLDYCKLHNLQEKFMEPVLLQVLSTKIWGKLDRLHVVSYSQQYQKNKLRSA